MLASPEPSLEVKRVKEKFSDNHNITFWNFLIIQYRSKSPQVKLHLTSNITNLVHELPHELLNDLILRVLEN